VPNLLQDCYFEALTDDYKLSDPVGHQMARLRLDPMYSKALIVSSEFKCLEEMLIVVSMLSVESIFFCPREKLEEVSVFNYWLLFKFMPKGSKKLEVLTY
jgi:HrpA-like RNA helicase